jgi:hypothetical protein
MTLEDAMPELQVVKADRVLGSFSWTDGFRPVPLKEMRISDEARKSPYHLRALVKRLIRQGRDCDEVWEMLDPS